MHRVVISIVLLFCTTACGDDAPDRALPAIPATESTVTVLIERSRFARPELVVPAGTTVRWVNADAFAHTVTSRDDAPVAFDSAEMGQDDTFAVTFEEPGTYRYFCAIHPTMRAVVTVG